MSCTANKHQELTTKLANFVRSSELSKIVRDSEMAEHEMVIITLKGKSPTKETPKRTHEITFHTANCEFDESLVESLSKLQAETVCICGVDYCRP